MMFKDKYIHKLYAFALAAVFALTLAGCGGGGGGTAAAPDPDPTPMPPTCTGDQVLNDAMDACVDPPAPVEPPLGVQAFINLAAAMLDTDDRAELRAGAYVLNYDEPAAGDTPLDSGDDTVHGGGVTSSLTTHEAPTTTGQASPATGVSDIQVSVTPTLTPPDDTDDFARAGYAGGVENAAGDTLGTIAQRSAEFSADASWENNPAAVWSSATDDEMGGGMNMDMNADDSWAYYYQLEKDLAGGRTLHLDLRSDLNLANQVSVTATQFTADTDGDGTNDAFTISTGRGDTGVTADIADIMTDGDSFTLPVFQGEVNFPDGGAAGFYKGIPGTFNCVEGTNAATGCTLTHQTNGKLGVEDGTAERSFTFTPADGAMVWADDTDWLAAGVWLTVPDDPQGDYAIGAFAYGSMPYTPADLAALTAITGTASYSGDAFGRYLEQTGSGDAQQTTSGRFTAAASLTADFDAADTLAGTIEGSLSGFVANGEDQDWAVNFESAPITIRDGFVGDSTATPPTVSRPSTNHGGTTAQASVVGFNAGASAHVMGHGLTGFWNGQFYGPLTGPDPNDATATIAIQPGSAAGTFGLTSERDPDDEYSLTVIGAFGAQKVD